MFYSENRGIEPDSRVVESDTAVKRRNGVKLGLSQIEISRVEVLGQALDVVGLRDDSNLALGGPSQNDLSRSATVGLGNGGNGLMLKQNWGILGELGAHLKE